MGLAHFVVNTCIKQDTLRSSGLARINVRGDANVTVTIDWSCTCHSVCLARLETKMGECLVGFCHAMNVFTLLDGSTLAFGGINQLASQPQGHGFFTTLARGLDQPAHCQRIATGWANLDWNLVGSTTYTTGFHFNQGSNGFECFFEGFQWFNIFALLDGFQSTINNTLGYGLLAALHNVVHEFGESLASIQRIIEFHALQLRDVLALISPLTVFRFVRNTTARPYSYRLELINKLLRTLGTVLGTALLAVFDTGGVQRTTNGVVANTRQVLDSTATDQHYAVLLQVMAFTTDVGRHFIAIGQTNTAHLTQCRVRLFWSGGIYTGTYTTALWAALQRGHVVFLDDALARLAHQLVYCCHLIAPLLS